MASEISADILTGQDAWFRSSAGVSLTQLHAFYRLAVDKEYHLWVADQGNYRVMRV
ncbi:MAG: hypothetical protein JXK93_06880 [Sphaerochaetaceae bacterium]|nr:hypothetical protein [Sphaerochaetaceae bacterium]